MERDSVGEGNAKKTHRKQTLESFHQGRKVSRMDHWFALSLNDRDPPVQWLLIVALVPG
jgi:hypothetical protein